MRICSSCQQEIPFQDKACYLETFQNLLPYYLGELAPLRKFFHQTVTQIEDSWYCELCLYRKILLNFEAELHQQHVYKARFHVTNCSYFKYIIATYCTEQDYLDAKDPQVHISKIFDLAVKLPSLIAKNPNTPIDVIEQMIDSNYLEIWDNPSLPLLGVEKPSFFVHLNCYTLEREIDKAFATASTKVSKWMGYYVAMRYIEARKSEFPEPFPNCAPERAFEKLKEILDDKIVDKEKIKETRRWIKAFLAHFSAGSHKSSYYSTCAELASHYMMYIQSAMRQVAYWFSRSLKGENTVEYANELQWQLSKLKELKDTYDKKKTRKKKGK